MKSINLSLVVFWIMAIGVPLIGHASPESAEISGDQNASVKDQSGELETITVTAQRRSENLQNVPVVVNTLSATSLADAGVTGALDLNGTVPGLELNAGTGSIFVFLRGVGNSDGSAGIENSTATYIDGIYYARVPATLLDLNSIDQIEVLKGPQGTLFGRNATGGLINVITRTPQAEPSIEASVGYANYDTANTKFYVTGGIAPGVAADLAIDISDQIDGWGRNVTTGHQAWSRRNADTRSKIVAQVADDTKITFTADYEFDYGSFGLASPAYRGTSQGSYAPNLPQIYGPLADFYDTRTNLDDLQIDKSFGFALKIEQHFSIGDFVSTTAYHHARLNLAQYDVDYIPDNYFTAVLDELATQKSQEFQLLSDAQSRIKWVVGAFYLDSQDGYNPGVLGGREFGGVSIGFNSEQEIKSYAGYTQATAEVVSDTHLTVGLRYTSDHVSINGTESVLAPDDSIIEAAAAPVSADTTFSKLTWKAVLDHNFTPSLMGFLSVSTGFQSGTYQTLPATAVAAEPETLTAYEIGFKSELLDNRLRINPSLFFYNIKNLQVDVENGPAVLFVNAGDAHVEGVDTDFEWVATDRLTFRGGASILASKYVTFTDAPVAYPNPGPNGGNLPSQPVNVSGEDNIERTPKYTADLNALYTIPTDSGKWDVIGGASYNSGFYWTPSHITRQEAYALLNSRVRYTFPSNHYDISLWGKNLANKEYYAAAYEQGGAFGVPSVPAAPRTYGIEFHAKF